MARSQVCLGHAGLAVEVNVETIGAFPRALGGIVGILEALHIRRAIDVPARIDRNAQPLVGRVRIPGMKNFNQSINQSIIFFCVSMDGKKKWFQGKGEDDEN